MSWVRIDDAAMTHPKIVGLSDKAFRLWVWGLAYCQQHLTDGFLPRAAMPPSSSRTAVSLVLARLWDAEESGDHRVHDYLDWNDSREYVDSVRQLAKARMVLVRDPEMRDKLRERDQDLCRYCGKKVNWADRKSAGGATYDHVTPGGGDTIENLVIACRGCNSRKQRRTPEQADMALLPPPVSKSVSRKTTTDSPLIGNGVGLGWVGSSVNILSEKEEKKDLLQERFDLFWAEYPRKVGKGDAWNAWRKLRPDSDLCSRIRESIQAHLSDPQWQKERGQFIPHPSRFLNDRRFEDELTRQPQVSEATSRLAQAARDFNESS